ncbi:MAG: Nif3-like dinuclear metal center hexameric protein [Phycisphaerales bacterium]|nr:Nif3-like dinuclear metal center hexameric protein [Phycisphaerales bacterium]
MPTKRVRCKVNTGGDVARVRVADLLAAVEVLCPLRFAADWDNVGLLAGRPGWPVTRVLIALDLTDAVAREALTQRADALVLYHPPIFKGIRSITPSAEGPTTLLPELCAARVALVALHTALDAAPQGTNDALLDPLEPVRRYPLEPVVEAGTELKLAVFVPGEQAARVRTALAAAGAGVIGNYTECSFELAGRGTFRGDETTRPAVGQKLTLETVDELRIEMVVPRKLLPGVVRALYATHPYEEPAFDLYTVEQVAGRATVGMGRVGELVRPQRGLDLLRRLKEHVDLRGATVVGDLRRRFRRVVAAAGAFGVRLFRDPETLVLTGEFKHHDALELLRRGVTAVHLGHAASERPVLPRVRDHLRRALHGASVGLARQDRSPYRALW